MNFSSVSNAYINDVATVLNSTVQSAGGSTNTSGNSSGGIGATPSDSSQLSPFARLFSTLQQIQQSDVPHYRQVTQQIAASLLNTAQAAGAEGNTVAANQLTQLSGYFANASQSGQLPNIQDLAAALGIGPVGRHRAHAAFGDTDGGIGVSETAAGQAMTMEQLANSPLNPLTIILNTLSNSSVKASQDPDTARSKKSVLRIGSSGRT